MKMLSPLVRKELRSLMPFIALVLFFVGLDLGYFLLSEFPDQYSLADLLDREEGGQEEVSFIIAFALAAGLLVREHEEGTLSFLDALPVSRSRVFWTKVTLGLGVLWLLPLTDYALRTLVYLGARTSLDTGGHWGIFLTGLGLSMASSLVYFSLNLALSFLRKFAVLALGLIFSTYLLLAGMQMPHIGLLNIFTLATPSFEGQTWLIPMHKLIVQLAGAAICLGLSYAGFQLLGDRAQRLKERRGMVVFRVVGLVMATVVWLFLLGYWVKDLDTETDKTVSYREWRPSRAKTARYQFIYPENRAELANQLIDRADTAEERVRQFLGAKPVTRIYADLMSSAPHTAGVAHWKSVQMDLTAAEDATDAVAIFAHETTHVYIDHETDGALSDQFNSTRFFHEGLASYVEHRFFRAPEVLPSFRRPAITARERSKARVSEMYDDTAFSRRLDTDLVYPMGEMFVSALVQRYGDEAPGQVLRAFARPDAPKDLSGLALWQDVFQACGYNLSEVEDLCLEELDRAVEREREFLAKIPRLRGIVKRGEEGLVIEASYPGEAPGFMLCRYRARDDSPPQEYLLLYSGGKDRFELDAAQLPQNTFWYQLGWQVPGVPQPIYETWVQGRVR